MKVIVNQDACIGCGACCAICDEVFDMNDEGLSTVKDGKEEIVKELEDSIHEAEESCPTGAIEIQ